MAKILVFQHVPYELLGTLNPLFKSAGFRIRYINFGRYPDAEPSLRGYDGLVILGGPMNLRDEKIYPHLNTEMQVIEEAIKADIPVLGICLGAQLVAKALGAAVKKNPEKEIGWYDISLTAAGQKDSLFKSFKKCEKIFQWHGDTFDMPYGAVHLAKSKICSHQAFRYGKKVYGLQFHLEVDQKLIERWLIVPHNKKELAELKDKIDPNQIRDETSCCIHRSFDLSLKCFGEFIKLFGLKKKRQLSSI